MKIGDTITVEGEEFIIVSMQRVHDFKGKSMSISCQDPFVAQASIDAWRAQIAQAETQAKMRELLPKLTKAIEE